ncbi:MAG: hypothetical protein KKA79_05605, partial [Nanoarchaeota archaeon]|nr:hypothetical protein [Nanoarchaeota archaeon]
TPKEIKSRLKLNPKKIKDKDYDSILDALNKSKISKDAIIGLLAEAAKGKKMDFDKFKAVDLGEVESFIKALVEKNPGAPIGGLMGDVMKQYRGSVDGQKAMGLLKKYHKG